MEMQNELNLIDLIDADTLTTIEQAFCEMTEMSAGISDPQGVPVTAHCNTSAFCHLVKSTAAGRARCDQCDKQGAAMALENHAAVFYRCHAGLIDFAAPITIQGEILGTFVGGQILIDAPDEEQALRLAYEINADPQEYLSALRKIPIVTEEQINDAAEFLYALSNILSSIGCSRYKILQSNIELEHATQSKSDFLANMSHEIRTPMNAIIGMTSLALSNTHHPEQVQEYLHKIELSSKHLLGLINDVLDISKIESGKMTLNIEAVSLREVMDSIVNIIQPQVRAKDQEFNAVAYEIFAEDVCCDSVRLNQVLINLLGNAVKFTPDRGTVQVCVYQEELPGNPSCVRTHFTVTDTGIGMSKEYQKQIFDSFSRENNTRVQKTEGSGLGMAITKYIVDAMGGSISVQSEQGKGSEFHVVLDLAKAKEQETDPVFPSWHMLVVDADERLCTNVVHSLALLGIRAEWCLSAGRAAEMIAESRRQKDSYQIVLLGWELQDSNGLEAARKIRQNGGKDDPALLLAACDRSEMEQDAGEAGLSGVIAKPLFQSSLADALRALAGNDGEETAEAAKTIDLDLKGKHILLAEDNDLNWEVARELLSDLELVLDRVENGKSCAAKFGQSPVGYYDAILMDVRMPVMDGYEATRIIREMERADADIPIIAMTADAFSEDIQKCLECGMNDHLAKPIDVQAVTDKLEKYLKTLRDA